MLPQRRDLGWKLIFTQSSTLKQSVKCLKKKKKRAEIHAKKVAAAKKKARDAEAAETAHQQNLKQRAALRREMRYMSLEDKDGRIVKRL